MRPGPARLGYTEKMWPYARILISLLNVQRQPQRAWHELFSKKMVTGYFYVDIPLLILGDAAYPMLHWLMRPYVGARLTPQQELFNQRHSSLRIAVENAFGRLKVPWRILKWQLDVDVLHMQLLQSTFISDHRAVTLPHQVRKFRQSDEVQRGFVGPRHSDLMSLSLLFKLKYLNMFQRCSVGCQANRQMASGHTVTLLYHDIQITCALYAGLNVQLLW